MAKIDEIKEEVALLRSLLITFIVIVVSLIGWMAQNIESNLLFYALIAVVVMCVIILWLLKLTLKKIKSLRDIKDDK